MAETDGRVYSSVYLAGKDRTLGELRVAADGFKWRGRSGRAVSVAASDVTGLSWAKVRAGYQVRVAVRGSGSVKFDGFKSSDREDLAAICRASMGYELESLNLSCKGLSWGEANVQGAQVRFDVDGAEAFEIPLAEVSQAIVQQKNEVSLELHQADTLAPEDETVVEIRFSVPAKTDAEGGADEDEGGAANRTAEAFVNEVISRADLNTAADAIAKLDDVPMAVPRGRYEIEFFASFLKLHGKTYDYKVMFSSVVSLYTLPKPDGYHVSVAVHLDPSIRQGATYYQFLIMQFPAEETLDVDVALTEKQIADKYGGKLEQQLSGPTAEVVARLVAGLTGRDVHTPAKEFKSSTGHSAIKCALKADEGHLFGFNRAFLFVNKPTLLLPYDQIAAAEFKRVEKQAAGGSSREFDMLVYKKSGDTVQFANIRRTEYSPIFNFLVAKKIKIKNITKGGASAVDEPEEVGAEEDDDLHMAKIKRARERRTAAASAEGGEEEYEEDDDDEDDEDDEDDVDFAGGDDSEVDEEFEEEDCSDDDEGAGRGGKAKGKAPKKSKVADPQPAGDEEEDEDDQMAAGEEDDDDDEAPGASAVPRAAGRGQGATAGRGNTASGKSGPAGGKEGAGSGRKKKAKVAKDPNAPKRPLTGYMLWLNEMRPKLKAEKPGLSVPELGKLAGDRWKTEDTEVRGRFEGMAKEARVRYDEEMKVYKAKQAKVPAAGGDWDKDADVEMTHRGEDGDDDDEEEAEEED